MSIFKRHLSVKLDKELVCSIGLILLFGGWLLLNFWFGFNLFIYLIAAIFGLLIPVIYPRAGLYALTWLMLVFAKFFTLQSLIINQQEYKFYLVDIIFVAVLAGVFIRLLKGHLRIKLKWPDLFLLAFLSLTAIYFVLSVLSWSGVFALSFSSFKNYAFYPLFYFVTYLLISDKQKLKTWLSFVMSATLIIIGFIVYGLVNGRGLWTEITPLSTIGSRILDFDHAFYLCLISLFGLSYIIFKRGLAVRWLYMLLPIFFIGIVGSLMRHLWVALVLAVIGIYFCLPRPKKPIFRQVIFSYTVILVVLGLLAIFLANTLPFSRFSGYYHDVVGQLSTRAESLTDSNDSSIAWRGAVWQGVWEKYKDNLVGGLGFGQKVFIDMGDYQDYVEIRNIHNSFLAIFVQLGLVGFAIFCLFALGVFGKLLKYKTLGEDGQTAKFALLAIMIFCATAFLFQPYLEANFFNISFWLSLGLAKRTYEGTFS